MIRLCVLLLLASRAALAGEIKPQPERLPTTPYVAPPTPHQRAERKARADAARRGGTNAVHIAFPAPGGADRNPRAGSTPARGPSNRSAK